MAPNNLVVEVDDRNNTLHKTWALFLSMFSFDISSAFYMKRIYYRLENGAWKRMVK